MADSLSYLHRHGAFMRQSFLYLERRGSQMATKSIECPSCDARLKVAATLPAGKKIRCPKCESAFAVPDDDEEPIEATPVTPTRKRKPAPPPEEEDFDDEEEEVEERPARRPRKRPKK